MIHFTSDNLNRYIAFKLGVERLNFDIFELSKLKELEIDPCADNLYFEVSSDIFKYFVSLETLTIKNMPCDESFLNEILKLQNLKSLRLVVLPLIILLFPSSISPFSLKRAFLFNSSIKFS